VNEESGSILKLDLIKKYSYLNEILSDKGLAKLGDSYVNFVYSLAKSKKKNELTNERVPSKVLAEALKKAGLREYLPSRTSRHDQGDAVEALIIYGWLYGIVPFEECVSILEKDADAPVEAFTNLILTMNKRLEVIK
jgi:hypothetical protein